MEKQRWREPSIGELSTFVDVDVARISTSECSASNSLGGSSMQASSSRTLARWSRLPQA